MLRNALHSTIFSLLIGASFAAANDALTPLRTDTPPVIDGKLDDSIWQQAPSVTGFKTFFSGFWQRHAGSNHRV